MHPLDVERLTPARRYATYTFSGGELRVLEGSPSSVGTSSGVDHLSVALKPATAETVTISPVLEVSLLDFG